MNFFDQAFDYVIANEGVIYTNDPVDSGGPTKFGVTLKAYQEHVGRLVLSDEIKDMSIDIAKEFYHKKYWTPLGCENLVNLGVSICMMDTGVLYGVHTASEMAQRTANLHGGVLNLIKVDGIIGPQSIEKLNGVPQKDFIDIFYCLILTRIETVIEAHPKNEKYRNGWTSRANRILTLNNIVPVINVIT